MTALNRDAAEAALAAGATCATDVTGFGLLGHLHKLAKASGVTAVLDTAAVPYLDGAREAVRDGFVSGGTRRNLEWVAPWTGFGTTDADTGCCWPTPRPPADCWSPERCPARRWWGSWCRTTAPTPSCSNDPPAQGTYGSVPVCASMPARAR